MRRGMAVTCLLLLPLLVHCATATPVVKAPWGTVSGVRIEGLGGKALDGYLGVPFALPPTGPLRWQKPVPHPGPADGQVFAAHTLQPACQQEAPGMMVYGGMSEDCLTLNVFVPVEDNAKQELRSTMVYIHGGGFVIGDAPTYRPTSLVADGGVIVVTIQYRLGAFGFLATGDGTLPGNYGLWDQQLALKWVKDNIGAFGGDPDSITIFGESAGGMSVGLQVLSPATKGLFRRAVLQSGSPTLFGDDEWIKDAGTVFGQVAADLNCRSDTKVEAVECLRALPAHEIADSKETAFSTVVATNPFRSFFGPVVDGDFLPREPVDLLQDADYMQAAGVNDVDILTGFNNNEGGMIRMLRGMTGKNIDDLPEVATFRLLLQNAVAVHIKHRHHEVVEKVVEFFYRGADAGTDRPSPWSTVTSIYGDFLFYVPAVKWARALAAHPHRGRRYMYVLDHDFVFNRHTPVPGSHHADELPLEFDVLGMEESFIYKPLNKTFDTDDIPVMTDMFVQVLAAFAKTGNPGGPIEDVLQDGKWPEFTDENEAYVALSPTPEVRQEVFADRMALWLKVVPDLLKATSPPGQREDGQGTAQGPAGKEEL